MSATTVRVWCSSCEHAHIPEIPRVTYACKVCGFGSWDLFTAAHHPVGLPEGHEAYPVVHDIAHHVWRGSLDEKEGDA